MISHQHPSLVSVIYNDLLHNAKIPLLLLITILFSAIFVVNIVHRTRLLIADREQLILEHDALDIEWRNLILEENALGDHSRIERIAIETLCMQHVDLYHEVVIIK